MKEKLLNETEKLQCNEVKPAIATSPTNVEQAEIIPGEELFASRHKKMNADTQTLAMEKTAKEEITVSECAKDFPTKEVPITEKGIINNFVASQKEKPANEKPASINETDAPDLKEKTTHAKDKSECKYALNRLSDCEILARIQSEIKVLKSHTANFGGGRNFNYRTCEDIFNSVKPILLKYNVFLCVSDDILQVGERFYLKATAIICRDGRTIASTTALAREVDEFRGMMPAQMTGSCSSYARKYALNGLLLLDDVQDVDSIQTKGNDQKQNNTKQIISEPPANDYANFVISSIDSCTTEDDLRTVWGKNPNLHKEQWFLDKMREHNALIKSKAGSNN